MAMLDAQRRKMACDGLNVAAAQVASERTRSEASVNAAVGALIIEQLEAITLQLGQLQIKLNAIENKLDG
ncbi:MAG: hypothetical protein F4X99_19945 [Gammaproteobacteria bacterium]|nr:hypothetical protein [Gammaproteobacteria bacterium]